MGGRLRRTVSFLSDYGLDDEFAGVVRSVIRSIAPEATVVDISHGVAPHDVRAGALTLVRAVQYLAPGVVLAVVDPGVGTDRRAVAVSAGVDDEAVFVGPDNGLLAPAVAMIGGAVRAVELTNPEYQLVGAGPTFSGRDVFAPAAAHLCNGVDLAELGEPVDPLSLRPALMPLSRMEDGRLVAEVLWVDRFGNAQLNVGPEQVEEMGEKMTLRWGHDQVRTGRKVHTYANLKPSEIGLVVDSYGLLSVVLDRRPAAHELKLHTGDAITLEAP
ncbi:MAG: SAM-dependent chlorinase/fluorinase [Acidimicrobiales bacterium]